MSALNEGLLAAQRQAIAALSKAYIAESTTELALREQLDAIGCTDKVEQDQLVAALDVLHNFGAPAPKPTQPEPRKTDDAASEAQMRLARKIADDRGYVLPDYPLTKDAASRLIDEMKTGNYDSDRWSVPF